ncbi:MAG: hypothetical protein K9I84_16400 [Leadbetterella sp.]|nr:hypothetical protein [Leadbetterella sp.]
MSVSTLPEKEKYSKLPRNMKQELGKEFKEEYGKAINAFISGRTIWTPRAGGIFNSLVTKHYDYFIGQKPEQVES